MDDYYELLGVDTDAQTEDIRVAYRDRKSALDNSTEEGRDEARRLNKAWNVLSDPYQRGRYDEQLSIAPADGDDIEIVDDAPTRTNGKSSAKTSSKSSSKPPTKAEQRAKAREVGPPTLTLPDGTHWPKAKSRIIAMVIDLFVLLVLYAGFSFIGVNVSRDHNAEAAKTYDRLEKPVQRGGDQDNVDDAQKALDDAKKNNAANQDDLQKQVDAAKQTQKDNQKAFDDAAADLAPIQNLFVGVFFLLAAIYLIVPSIITGRTFGKRTQHLKVLRDDGAPLGVGTAIKRYGALVIVVYAATLIGQGSILALVIPAAVLYAILRWMRNNNMQGVHDRFAHTIVVSDAAE